MIFTEEEVRSFNVDGLRRLCRYFEIDIPDKAKKKEMIEGIMIYLKEHEEKEEDKNAPKRSPMVQRIYERMKEK